MGDSVPIQLNSAAADVNGLSAVSLLRADRGRPGHRGAQPERHDPPRGTATFALRATDRAVTP